MTQLDTLFKSLPYCSIFVAKIENHNNMDLIAIERDSFDSFKKKLEQIVSFTKKQPSVNNLYIEKEWIEGKELTTSLNITLRSLQYMRENGKLSFSTIGKKIYYRIAEVKFLLEQSKK